MADDAKKDGKKDLLAELDLAGLFEKRTDAVKRQKEAEKKVEFGKFAYFFSLWAAGGVLLALAVSFGRDFPDISPHRMFLFTACVIFWLLAWVAAFFPATAIKPLQDKASAAGRAVKDIEGKIAFCNQVLEEARRVKVQRYAEAWVEKKELS